jgi:hypothetical protein
MKMVAMEEMKMVAMIDKITMMMVAL